MKSHIYDLKSGDLANLAMSPLIAMVVFAVLMRLGASIGILPQPWPALDMDHTIITHQAEASRTPSQANVLLIGDSSCLMDVSAKQLGTDLGDNRGAINLGSIMYLGLNGYVSMLSRYVETNPERLRTVVLLLHPEMLRGIEPVSAYWRFLMDYYAGVDSGDTITVQGQLRGFFGLDILRNRVLSRTPIPLPKAFGHYYGFNLDLNRFMEQHHGSVVDPHQYASAPGQGNAEYRLSPSEEMRNGFMALKAAVPKGAKLLVGITPIPESFAAPGYAKRNKEILIEWSQLMEATALDIPPTMPDTDFATTTHLNESGSRRFTSMLAEKLK